MTYYFKYIITVICYNKMIEIKHMQGCNTLAHI